MKLRTKTTTQPDNTGGFDVAVLDENGCVVAVFYEHVGFSPDGTGYIKLPALENAQAFCDVMRARGLGVK